ncbi:MAG: nitrate reductase subunit beta [Acidobacteriota bacterium]
MDVRAQVAMVFHLDKCIGCHTCSIACKNIWTDRPGAEYMWWNNVETKPGTGYPTLWEDQEEFRGGWTLDAGRRLRLRSQGRWDALARLFYNPNQPTLEDYYEPWTYRYEDLFANSEEERQPTARPISALTGEPMEIEAGPNWDDDLSGSPLYAENDPNLAALSAEEREQLFAVERLAMMYLPRICNHCLNPACVAACPSGALYKRGEDGVVLVDQERCRGWRACVPACPYKKVYYNWRTGKSEKCILCFPRIETAQPPACFHSCVGRIRYLGIVLYDADGIETAAKAPVDGLAEAQLQLLLDPEDSRVIAAAERNGVPADVLEAARRSPVWKFVGQWRMALPLHPEYRTLPMLFYVPPLLPVLGESVQGVYQHDAQTLFADVDRSRIPVRYLASLFAAGKAELVEAALRKLVAVRHYMRHLHEPGGDSDAIRRILRLAGLDERTAQEIQYLTAIAPFEERFVIPPSHLEEVSEDAELVQLERGEAGLGVPRLYHKGRTR